MKKIKRILAALILCVLAFSLAGCAELDEMKARHAVWLEKNETIQLNGATYRRLEPSAMLEVWDAKDVVFVTNEDVPVLLSKQYGERMSIGESGILLESYEWVGDCPAIYCHTDHYESVKNQIVYGPTLSEVLYNYWDDEGNNMEYRLSPQEIAAVEAILAGAPSLSGVERYHLDESFSFNLERSSADGLFRTTLCEVLVDEQKIRLVKDIDYDGLVEVYDIPAEQFALFEKIIEKFAAMHWTGYYFSTHPVPEEYIPASEEKYI